MGFNRIFADSGYFLGTLLAGLLLDQFGFRIPVYCIAVYALVTMLITYLTIPNRPTDFIQK
jgi:predicted MFS family arabinose efflux permease